MKATLIVAVATLLSFSAFAGEAVEAPLDPSLNPTVVRAELEARRALQLENLRGYRDAGVFPDTRGMGFAEPLPVFLDEHGVACAFASLMIEDGHDAVVIDVSQTNNHLVVAEVEGGPVLDWIAESGLTHDEAARVQVPGDMYMLEPMPFEEPSKVDLIRAQLDGVIERLEADAEASLDEATAALIAKRKAEQREQVIGGLLLGLGLSS